MYSLNRKWYNFYDWRLSKKKRDKGRNVLNSGARTFVGDILEGPFPGKSFWFGEKDLGCVKNKRTDFLSFSLSFRISYIKRVNSLGGSWPHSLCPPFEVGLLHSGGGALLNRVAIGSTKKSGRICDIKGFIRAQRIFIRVLMESLFIAAAWVKCGAFIIADGPGNDGAFLPSSIR